MGRPRWRSRGSHTRPRASRPGRSFFASPGSGRTATTSPRRPSSGARWRWCASARSASRVPEVVVPDVRAAMGPAAARFHGDPTAELDVIGITGTNGKTTTAFLARHLLEADGRSCRPARHGQAGGGRGGGGGGAHHPRGDRPPGHLPADGRGGRQRLRDGGVLARARARPRRRDPLRLPRVHEPDAGPPGLPPLDGRLLRGQAAAVRGPGHVDREPGRSLGAQAGRGARLRDLRDRARRGLPGARRALRPRRLDLRAATRPTGSLELRSPLPGVFNVQNVLAAVAAVRVARGPARHRRRRRCPCSSGCPAASSRWTRDRTSACSWTTPIRPTRSRTCSARRASSPAGGSWRCSAPAATATAPSGR